MKRFSLLGGAVSLLVVLLTIVFSPYILGVIAQLSNDWVRLSDVGQSYSAAGAVFSGLAFIGVVLTLFVQNRQAAFQQALSLRALHFDLLRTAIENPDYERSMQTGQNELGLPLWAYFNLRLQTIYFFWRSGEVDDENATAEVRYLMGFPIVREWWTLEAEPLWSAGGRSRSEERFLLILTSALNEAATRPLSAPEKAVDDHKASTNRGLLIAVTVGLAAGAAVSATCKALRVAKR